MAEYDVVLIHPPSFYDFRRGPWFPGPIDRTVPNYTPAFIMFPIGLISMGAYIQDNGFKVKIINLAEKMIVEKDFDVEHFLRGLNSKIYAVDLHWAVHSQGAIMIAQICKKHHPDSKVILGGLTATCFADELVSSFNFIDCVVRGEGEEPLLRLVESFNDSKVFHQIPNLTFLDKNGEIARTESLEVFDSIDSLDFTRLDLVEPVNRTITSVFYRSKLWNIPICRGCTLSCVTCGGSSYSYQRLMNRSTPAFRSPEKILEDLMILDEKKIGSIFLFQDPRLGGEKYVRQLFEVLKGEKWSSITSIGIELFHPAGKSFIRYLSENKPADHIGLSISPESGLESVRRSQGREYSNDELLKTCRYCREYDVPIGIFYMIALGNETFETIRETWKLWKKIYSLEDRLSRRPRIFQDFGPMIFLDPGSLAFDHPERYGYKLRFKKFQDYYSAMNSPHWSQWISYETKNLSRQDVAYMILKSAEKLLEYKKIFGRIREKEYENEKLILNLDKIFIREFDELMKMEDEEDRNNRIRELAEISKDPLLSLSYILTEDE
ncbi:MAG: radical SAM protein [Candidatus Bathyarchaeia archaeon]